MAYVTEQNLIDRFTEAEIIALTDADGDGERDSATIEDAIADAGATIDSYLGARYKLPFETPPAVLEQYAADLAFERLHPAQPPEEVAKRADTARAWLKDVAAGRASLPIGVGDESDALALPASQTPTSIYDAAYDDPLTLDYRGF